MEEQILFKTKTGLAFPAVSSAAFSRLWQSLQNDYGLTLPQLCEAASYSQAMVLRYALGLSALGGRVFAIVTDTRAGWIALAALRHMLTAGANGGIVLAADPDKCGEQLELQIKPLQKIGAEFVTLRELLAMGKTLELVESCHNLICGLFDPAQPEPGPDVIELIKVLNEARTPVHSIEAPPGVHPDSGNALGEGLFSSSTLSIGAPLTGLHPGNDYVGRHYLCDISIPAQLYLEQTADLSQLFAEQPVIQIFAVKDAEKAPQP